MHHTTTYIPKNTSTTKQCFTDLSSNNPQTLRVVLLSDCLTRPSDVFVTAAKTA